MEISERSLRALVAATDDQHRAGMNSLPNDIRALHHETRRFRRALADGDAGVAAFAESVELTAVAAYTAAAQSGLVTTKAVLEAVTVFSGHHTEHAAAFGAAAGGAATGKLNQGLLDALSPSLSAAKNEMDVLQLAYDLENAAAATYLFALGALESTAALQLTASILPVEAQHAVVIGQIIGADPASMLPSFETETGFVDPSKYPVG